ncbi:APC family permease [Hydrocarboniphaga effusa]|uniref:APC family permease n=1 Tax=Hydrocarboniphaga effusa TaxID=243629 RepID=UPI00398C050D
MSPVVDDRAAGPRRHLGTATALVVTLGMMITTDILKTAPTVAQGVGESYFYAVWLLGGVLSVIGALCFAELAAAFPDAGGDYHFLRLAYGPYVGFVYAWSRFSVLHTGWIALTAFLFADHLASLLHWPQAVEGWCAAAIVLALVASNFAGMRMGLLTQTVLVALVALGFIAIISAAWWSEPASTSTVAESSPSFAGWSSAMIYVLLALGGWGDAATLSAEARDGRRGLLIALVGSIVLMLAIYLAVNWAFVRGLGFDGLAASEAPAVELLTQVFGKSGGLLIVIVVGVTAVSSINAVLIAGPRVTFAAARDVPALGRLGTWNEDRGVPAFALLAIGAVSLLLIAFGSYADDGFNAMVEYMTPVYWFFMSLSGFSLIVLRRRFPQVERPFAVPFYPWLPLLFLALCIAMFCSSVVYVGWGALLGLGISLIGALVLALLQLRRSRRPRASSSGVST